MAIRRLSFSDKMTVVRWLEDHKAEAESPQLRSELAAAIKADTGHDVPLSSLPELAASARIQLPRGSSSQCNSSTHDEHERRDLTAIVGRIRFSDGTPTK